VLAVGTPAGRAVTDTDRRLLTLLAEQRVLTRTQLERLLADTPARTLRYPLNV
jgi:hypothetical protein